MKRKLNGSTTVAISMFLVSGVLAGVLGVRQVERQATHFVVGLQGNWPVGTIVQPSMLKQVRVDKEVSGIAQPNSIMGMALVTEKSDGEPLALTDLKRRERSWLAQQAPENKVLYTLTPGNASIPHSQLRNGDSFDVLVAGRNGVRTVARDARLIGVMNPPRPSAVNINSRVASLAFPKLRAEKTKGSSMVIAVAAEEVYPLASIGAGEQVSIVLHGQYQGAENTRPIIDPKPTHRRIELVAGAQRRVVAVEL